MPYLDEVQEADNKKFFENLLEQFEKNVWPIFEGHSISKSAAFTAFVQCNQTYQLIKFFDECEMTEEGDEWKDPNSET